MARNHTISAEDVLRAFAMDYESGAGVLKRYLAEYPEHAVALVDLSRELSREIDHDDPLSVAEVALVTSRMERLRENTVSLQTLQAAPAKTFAEAFDLLALPMQVGLAFHERRIDVATLPQRVAAKVAEALKTSTETLLSYLMLPAMVPVTRARKSIVRPIAPEKVSFEKVLRDAGLDDQSISNLLR